MCRWLAYSGSLSGQAIKELLLDLKHLLIIRRFHARLGETTNGDGFGIGWYGVGDTPGPHSIEPA